MTLSPDIRHTIRSHTEGMNLFERRRSARTLIRRYSITQPGDIDTVAELAAVRKEDLT